MNQPIRDEAVETARLCPKCFRTMNEGNSPNDQECTETDDEEGLCEAYAKIYLLTKACAEQERQLAKMKEALTKALNDLTCGGGRGSRQFSLLSTL